MKKKHILVVAALMMLSILGISTAFAFSNGKGMPAQDREALQNARSNGDYETWREIKIRHISEDRFNEARARHQERAEFRSLIQEARESGDYSRLQEVKETFGKGKGMHRRNMNLKECLLDK